MKQDSELEVILGYQVQRAFQTMAHDALRVLKPHNLTPAKLTALLLIRANPGCGQTMLGRALSINRSSAMKLVNALEMRDLVERRPGRNLRTNALHLRPTGEAKIDEMIALLRDSDRRMSARLSNAEIGMLFALLRKIGPARARRIADRG